MRSRICIVDHDRDNLTFLQECLTGEGHDVLSLGNGLEIRNHLCNGDFSAVILNIETPGVRGGDLFNIIQKAKKSRVLLIVSERGDVFLKEAMNMGVYGFIYKPFNLQEVCAMVRHLTR
jgi:DNA-binding NtrC family response regulator